MKVLPPLEIEPATSNAGGIECTIGLLGCSSRVHVAWVHGIDDSKRAGTVNTHCWKVARVVFVSSDRGAQWANMYWGASGKLEVTGVRWFGGMAYSKLEGTCVNAGCSMVGDTCVLVTVEPSVVSPWLVFCLRLVRTLKGRC